MPNVQSKFVTESLVTCKDFLHPWTDSCANASAGVLLSAVPYCLRVYSVVYVVSMLLKHRIPTKNDLKKIILGILQSTAFLTTNAFGFTLYTCLVRQIMGRFTKATVAFVPTFLAAFSAILVETPARRPLLALYVANVATETVWNMAEARGWVRSIPQGQTLIFGLSISVALYLFRLGLHKTLTRDPMFRILSILVGRTEEGPLKKPEPAREEPTNNERSRPPISLTSIQGFVALYGRFIERLKNKHASCLHKSSCLHYAVLGGINPFFGGVGLQILLRLLMNLKKIVQLRMDWRKNVFNRNTLKLGVFLGGFSFLYKAVSCTLRHCFDRDDPLFAIPAGLIGSIAFSQYPDISVSLYVMWKILQLLYNLGIKKGVLPEVPGFTILLYSTCTAILFHAGILEALTLRGSYYKFLQEIGGERLTRFNLKDFDVFGLKSVQQSKQLIEQLKIVNSSPLPLYSLAS